MALLASITPVSILTKQASYIRASIARYDLMASECYVKYDLLNSSGEYVFGETYKENGVVSRNKSPLLQWMNRYKSKKELNKRK